MTKLIIKLKGKTIKEVQLTEDKEYIIGRGKESHIILPEQTGISRKHLSLSKGEQDQWMIKNLSQISAPIVEGEPMDEGTIPLGGAFQVQDFEFLLQVEGQKKSKLPEIKQTPETSSAKSLYGNESPLHQGTGTPPIHKTANSSLYRSESSSLHGENPPSPESDLGEEDQLKKPDEDLPEVVSTDGKTRIVSMESHKQKLSAYLKVSYDDNTPIDIFKLEDQEEWIFGRDEIADIMVDSPNISREHFKISASKEGTYYIKDLKSSNGTILNDKELSPGKKYPIQSGDVIYILDIEIVFEIKNLSLEKELAKLTTPSQPASRVPVAGAPSSNVAPPPAGGVPGGYMPPPLPAHVPGVIVETSEENEPSFLKKNKKRLIIYGVLGVFVGAIFLNTNKKKEVAEGSSPSILKTGEGAGLNPQQLELVKVHYQTAQQLYSQGKFETCQSEVVKIYEYIDTYRDSKRLEIACAQAAENQRVQYDLDQKKRKAEETEKRIQEITDKCREKFDTFTFKHELVSCLNQAIELSPADSRIHSLTEKFDAIEMEKEEKKKKIAERKTFISSIANKYTYAKKLYKSGKVLKAMAAYQRFINISNHNELRETRAKAQRELANIKKSFNDKNNRLMSECSGKFNARQFKNAYYACENAYQKIPSPHNRPAREFMQNAKQKLELKMKPIYEEANLNESVGNVSHAQEHWKKILNQDVKAGLYYQRAKTKMNKY